MTDIKTHFAQRASRFPTKPPADQAPRLPTWLAIKQSSDLVEASVSDTASTSPLLQPTDVAALLGVGVRTLERWRSTGEGPQYIKLSIKTIRYTDAAVATFIAARVKANTAS